MSSFNNSIGGKPTFRREIVESLPLYYRAGLELLAEQGEVVISDTEVVS
jgi:hypothetical protein